MFPDGMRKATSAPARRRVSRQREQRTASEKAVSAQNAIVQAHAPSAGTTARGSRLAGRLVHANRRPLDSAAVPLADGDIDERPIGGLAAGGGRLRDDPPASDPG